MIVVRRAGVSGDRRSWTRSRPGSCSPRGSAGSATGGTRSSTASRRRCRGASKIDPAHRVGLAAKYLDAKAYQPTFLYELLWDLAGVALLLWLDKRYRSGRRRSLRSTSRTTASGASSRSCCGSTPRTTSSGLRLNAWVSIVVFVGATGFFVWWQVLGRGGSGRDGQPRERPRPRPTRRGPKMAIPRGRVR